MSACSELNTSQSTTNNRLMNGLKQSQKQAEISDANFIKPESGTTMGEI